MYEVIFSLEEYDAASIGIAQGMLTKPNIKSQLTYICANFLHLKYAILELEKKGLPLVSAVNTVLDIEDNLPLGGTIGLAVKTKWNYLLKKNKGFKTIQNISKVLEGDESARTEIEENLSPSDLACFKFAPISSAEVERSFSTYKTLLADKLQSFTFEHLRETYVTKCNAC